MIELVGLNYWAVLVVWFVYMAVGAYWYSLAGFAKQWTKYTGIDILKIPQDQATRILMFVALSAFVQSLILGVILHSLQVTSILHSLVVALVLWLGFTAATTVGTTLYSKRSWKFLWLNSSYFLLVMTFGAIIFALWR
jgi:hypothetical protein